MAGASINDIKSRMKSVQSTMQITKAMELVATSKLRRAKEKVERSRPYYELLSDAIKHFGAFSLNEECKNPDAKHLYVVIAGDRGLAGGYNANVFRLTEALAKDKAAIFLPIGKKACEYCKHRGYDLFSDAFSSVSTLGVGDSFAMADLIADSYTEGKIDGVTVVYTRFVSMMSYLPVYEELLPLPKDEEESTAQPLFEEEEEDITKKLLPYYAGGIIYSAVSEALASESAARRSSMNAANKNAQEMIDTLMLKYNRARQAVITQEITEIVSGAEAL